MTNSKGSRISLVLAVLGGAVAAGCNDTNSACLSACQHSIGCAADGGAGFPPTYCQDSCNALADGGSPCTNLVAAFNCIDGLSCADLRGTGEPSNAYFACV